MAARGIGNWTTWMVVVILIQHELHGTTKYRSGIRDPACNSADGCNSP